MQTVRVLVVVSAIVIGAAVSAQQGGPPGAGRANELITQAGPVQQIPRTPAVDQAAHDRGRAIWARECVDCHGTQARGSETGPNIIRTKTVNFDRSSLAAGSVLAPFLKAGHKTQSGKASATFTDEEIVGLAHFLRQCVNDTMRGSAVFTVGDILVGDRAAGKAYFEGAGKCATCHNATARNLAGIGTRIPAPVDIQQRTLFPGSVGGRGRGAGTAPTANPITVEVSTGTGPAISGVLLEQSDFFVTMRLADGSVRAIRKAPGTKVAITTPLQAHIDLLEVITDTQIHDLVAYLESLK